MKRESDKRELDGGMLIFGIISGLLVGGLVTLFRAPRTGSAFRHQLNETGQNLLPSDPVADSMAEGKAAAQRRLAELGRS